MRAMSVQFQVPAGLKRPSGATAKNSGCGAVVPPGTSSNWGGRSAGATHPPQGQGTGLA
ncbi:hypothetical protein CCM_08405 [Cordyceps militaris CM01]|uniref:Uncharacterized protein n=1 Tax=Cordyceps militaris (strain CM01) TaxID=983644 RepID=G3JR66_CORMM|nr:uncharacterized protein CCM_08405 [Cordyceps militaris CM01]EGX88362.1 hypothetical protein CCM_08405 [Cordyceps militaris CM01]